MKVSISKSKNAESFYIKQSYIDGNGKSTSRTIRKLGTLKDLLAEHGPSREDVINGLRNRHVSKRNGMNWKKKVIVSPLYFTLTGRFHMGRGATFKAATSSYSPFTTN